MQWGSILRQYRELEGLSQRALGVRADVRQATISELENNQVPHVELGTVLKLARALGISVAVLTGEEIHGEAEIIPQTCHALEEGYKSEGGTHGP